MSSIQRFVADRVDSEVRKYIASHDGTDYVTALHEVLAADEQLRASYARLPIKKTEKPSDTTISNMQQKQAGDKLNEMALDLLSQSEDVCDYAAALRIVMAEHPDLARKYTYG